ncbi:MAG: hypothetical protein IPJ43_14725 [Saprospiraceae bacterium]|nr:hypothetical protein [Saprospiraceae bacterium]
MKKFIVILIFSLFNHFVFSQCGTTQYAVNPNVSNSFPDGPRYVNLNIHIVKYDDCSGGATLEEVGKVVDRLNESFNPGQIYFNVACILDFCKTECYENNCLIDNYYTSNSVPNGLNLYIALGAQGGSAGPCSPTGRAQSTLPSINCWAQISSTDFIIPTHEIGHCLGLPHTFNIDECVPRDPLDPQYNCPTTGDKICDTPADYRIYDAVDATTCTWNKALAEQMNIRDICGNVLETDPTLVMSYSSCGTRFSSQQFQIMRNNIFSGSAGPQAPPAEYASFYISNPTVWNTPKRFSVDVIVANSLTILGTSVHMAPGKKINLQNEKSITITNSLITVGTPGNCGGNGNGVMWKGIEIHASTAANVSINSGSIIDKAENGLYLATANDNKVWITINNATFTDNYRALSLICKTIAPRAAWINNTSFKLTSSYPIGQYSRQLYLGNFPLFNVVSLHFKNDKDINAIEAGGLYSYNGYVKIGSGSQDGFYKGIEGIGFGFRNPLVAKLFNSKKSVAHFDIKSRRANSITDCIIDEGDRVAAPITSHLNFGLRIDDCQANTISGNTFEDKKMVTGNWEGLIVNNVGSEYQKIGTENYFKKLVKGASMNFNNRNVEFLCNYNFINERDFDWSQAQENQGVSGKPAGNTFSPSNGSIDFKNIRLSSGVVNYHYGIGSSEFPMSVSRNVTREMEFQNGCLYNSAIPSDDITQLDGDYLNIKTQLDGLLPLVGGSGSNNQTIESQIHDLTIQLHDIMNHAIEIITTPESGEINYPLVITWLQRINTFESMSNIAYIYFMNGNYTQALSVFANLPSQFTLNALQLQEWNSMSWLMNFMNSVGQDGRWEGALNVTEIVSLQNFANANATPSGQMAANILAFFYNAPSGSNQNMPIQHQVENVLIDSKQILLTERSKAGIAIYPTPMNQTVNIDIGNWDKKWIIIMKPRI